MLFSCIKNNKKFDIEVMDAEITDVLADLIFRDYFSKDDMADKAGYCASVCSGLREYLSTITVEEFNSLVDCYEEELLQDFLKDMEIDK